MFERRLYYYVDWALILAIVLLCAIGIAMIQSATGTPGGGASPMVITQISAIAIGLGVMVALAVLDYRRLADQSLLLYGALLAVLLYVLLAGDVQMGARRWISIGSFNLQPSEFAKIGMALVLAKFFGESRGRPGWGALSVAACLAAVPMFLIAREPDLGTAVTLVPGLLAIAYVAGMRMRVLGILTLCLVLMAPIVWMYGLQDYQRSRISTFLDPSQDARGAGYQQIQARITVGSGGLMGKGYKQGTQGQLRFLPVAHNDFIFSVLAEEQGFAGVIVVLGLYLFVILRTLEAAQLAKDRLGSYLVLGVLASFTFQVVYNITMSAGLAPVKGLTLPLMSYGGSSMIATLAAFGLVLNVRMRRFTN
ncbi:MAG: rod shape-determining protein RodA [Vicinamibacterales bacterium]